MAIRQNDASKEALLRLPKLDIRELREQWCRLYKADTSPPLSRELLIRAVAHRMQEVALGLAEVGEVQFVDQGVAKGPVVGEVPLLVSLRGVGAEIQDGRTTGQIGRAHV